MGNMNVAARQSVSLQSIVVLLLEGADDQGRQLVFERPSFARFDVIFYPAVSISTEAAKQVEPAYHRERGQCL